LKGAGAGAIPPFSDSAPIIQRQIVRSTRAQGKILETKKEQNKLCSDFNEISLLPK
jgi:hypothetical protein